MKNLFFVLLLVFCSIMFAGCVMSGNKNVADEDLVNQIKKGKYTKNDVRETLDDPTSKTTADSGEETWTYEYYEGNRTIVDFIPIINTYFGQSKSKAHIVTIVFTENGVVKSIRKYERKIGTTSVTP